MELIGRRFGHIRVTDVIGQGGMGDVYGAFDETLERKVALKVLNADQRLDDEARERLLREARALSKLEHPNICRIHDYIESDEVDLLVLEYIDGQTLFDAQSEGMARSERLRIAIAIAEVLITAHRGGILHRDLKPENVMLTKTGEVKVLDFGLARWLHRRSSSSGRHGVARLQVVQAGSIHAPAAETVLQSVNEAFAESSARQPIHTAIGITLGTPLYMSPEQARGLTLTSASDMFSFGLLLQWLFTGKDPHPIDVTAREAILRVARGETLPVEGVAGDITALINRLKQFAPADRPTAVEALERLRNLASKPQRIARRSIAAAVTLLLVAGVWRYTVDLRRERALAVAARADADRRRAQAEGLIEFMLGDLRKKLEPVGRLDILDDVGKRAIEYVGSLNPAAMSADELAQSTKALNQLGEVRMGQGNLGQALLVFQRSLALAQYAVTRDPRSAPAQLALATSHFWVGDVYRQQGKLNDALKHYTNYMTAAEKLARDHPESEEYQLERAYGHSVVASIYERQGEYTRALAHLRLTRDVKQARLDGNIDDPERQADLARTLNRIGFVLERSGDLRAARAHYEQEFATYSNLASRDPRNSRWQDRLVTSHSYLGSLLEMLGDLPQALAHRQAGLALTRELSARDPQNAQWQRNLAIAQVNYGDMLRLNGRNDEALRAIREADVILQKLILRDAAVPSWKRDLAVVRTSAARVYLARSDLARAESAAASAVTTLEPIAGTDAAMPLYLGDGLLVLGDARAKSGDPAHAREAWSKAVAVLTPLVQTTASPEILDTVAQALLRLGRNAEAAPIIEKLTRSDYRAPDFESALSTTKRGGST